MFKIITTINSNAFIAILYVTPIDRNLCNAFIVILYPFIDCFIDHCLRSTRFNTSSVGHVS